MKKYDLTDFFIIFSINWRRKKSPMYFQFDVFFQNVADLSLPSESIRKPYGGLRTHVSDWSLKSYKQEQKVSSAICFLQLFNITTKT